MFILALRKVNNPGPSVRTQQAKAALSLHQFKKTSKVYTGKLERREETKGSLRKT